VNDVQLVMLWIQTGPSILYVFFAGALSDKFGRKPLILIPLLGFLFANVATLVNAVYLEELPVQFFYLEESMSFFGGLAVYYLGIYGLEINFTLLFLI